MAGTGKDPNKESVKEPKEPKEKKAPKDDSAALLRRVADELAALRSDVEALKANPTPNDSDGAADGKRKGKKSAPISDEDNRWQYADIAAVAQLGYAFSSVPKVAILRSLIQDGPQSASQLGQQASLTTGSLYHHLRELTHAKVIISEERSRFSITEYGRAAAMRLIALVA